MQTLRLGQLLLDAKVLNEAALEKALAEQRRTGGKLGEILVRLHLVSEERVVAALGEQLNLAVASLEPLPVVPPDALARVPLEVARAYRVLPLEFRAAERLLIVATAEPLKGQRLDELREHAKCWIVPRLAGRSALQNAIERLYSGEAPAPVEAASPQMSEAPARPKRTAKSKSAPHPDVRALIKLLVAKGILTQAELDSHFKD